MARLWSPAMGKLHYEHRPPIGSLIAIRRQPWRVHAVEELQADEWSDEDRARWAAERMPDPWPRAPFRLIVTPPDGGDHHAAAVHSGYRTWHVLPEHYAVCVSCGELAPCREHTATIQAQQAMERMERDMKTPPGWCAACQEPITRRQESITYPGDNLLVPLGPPNVSYHLRNACRGRAARYEEMWVKADPTRPRSLLTLYCEGGVIVHQDGSAECHGADDCPSVYARHRYFGACYTQTRGCGRGCTRTGHPGCRIAGRPKGVWV